jgi:hypothetical protein
MLITFSFEINPAQVTQYLDYALFGIFGIIALGFINGYIRGIWREGFRLIFVGGLVVFSILFTRQLVDLFMNIDLSSIAASAGYPSITLNVNAAPIIVSVSTPYQTIYNLLEQSLLAFGIFITPSIADLVFGLTLLMLRYLLFIVLAIIIFLIGESVAAILYFIPFRFLIPRHLRKKVKLRLLGGVAGALKMVLILTMFLSPFTSLINSVTKSFKDFDEQYGTQVDAELYNEIMSFINVYNDSTLAQTLFSWSITENGLSIDAALMDYVTGQDLDGYRLTLANELGSFTEIAAALIASGAIDSTFTTIDTSLLLTEDFVTNLVSALTGSVLIMKILPIAVAIGSNLDEVSSYLDPSLIELEGLVWEDELEYLGDVFKGVIRSGILTPILNGSTDTAILMDAIFSASAAPEINQILESLDESPFLSQVIPAVLFKLVEDEIASGGPQGGVGLSTFLPSNWADYQSIQFGSELSLIYDLVYELNSEVDGLFNLALPANESPLPLGRKQVNDPASPTIVEQLSDHFDIFVQVLLGEVNNLGQPINNNPVTGKSINRRSLLDSDLIMTGLPSIVENLLLPSLIGVAGENFDDTDLNELIENFNDGDLGEVRLSYKGEFAGILSILKAVITNEVLVSLIQPEPGQSLEPLSLLEDVQFRKVLKTDLIPTLDRSQIILTVVPGILESTLTGSGFDDFLSLISLTTSDLNFEFTSLSRELIIVIDMMGYAFNVLEASDDLLNQFPTVAFDLIGLLDNIYLSDIINKNPITNNKTTNYNQMIKGIFTLIDGIGIEEVDIDIGFNRVTPVGQQNGWTTTFVDSNNNDKLDASDSVSYAGENYHLVNFLKTTLESDLLNISGDIFEALNELASGSEDLADPNVSTLYKIFAYADRSEIISASFGGILDNLFGTTGGLIDPDLGTSFRNVTSWTEEGSNLLFLVKQINNFSGGLDNLDFLNSDVSILEELLQGLAASDIFSKPNGEYVFPDFLLDQLTGIPSLNAYFLDPTPYQVSVDNNPNNSYTIVTQDFYQISNQVSTKSNWYGEKTLLVNGQSNPILDINGDLQYEYVGGEIENIVGFISEIQSISINDLTSGLGIDGNVIREVLLSLNEAGSLRVLIYNMFDSIFNAGNLDFGTVSFSDTNPFVFLELNQTKRALEIEATADLLNIISDMGLDNGGAFDLDNFNESTILLVGELLTTLHDAQLFNSFKIGNSRASNDSTVFEQTYQFLLLTTTLDSFIYDDGLSSSQREQELYLDLVHMNNNFGQGTTDDWVGVEGEIQKFVDIMVAFVNTEIDFINFDGNTIGNLLDTEPGLTKVENLLLAMNESAIVYPAIPNLFSSILQGVNFSSVGVDFSMANFHYRGNRNNPINPLNDDIYLPYENVEVSTVLSIFSDVKVVGNRSYTSIKDLSNEEIDDMANLVTDLHDSQVFHQTGPSSGLNSDLTIFEQMIAKMFKDTGLASIAFDSNRLDDVPFGNANNKADYLVLNFSTLFPVNNSTHLTDNWLNVSSKDGEIVSFFRIFKELKVALPNLGSASSIDSASLSPTSIGRILAALNYSSLTSDAVKKIIKEAFVGISFGTYTENNETYELNPVQFLQEDINIMNYTSLPGTVTRPGLIQDLFSSFYDPVTDDYISIGGGFNVANFLNSGGSLYPMVNLLSNSRIFGNPATKILNPTAAQTGVNPFNVSTPGSFKTRALTFYNFLDTANVGKYFDYLTTALTDKEEKVIRVEEIFSGDFDEQYESVRLNSFIATISQFTNLSNASTLDQYSSQMRSLIELTYTTTGLIITDRAFMVSELSAGFFTDIFKNEYGLVEDTEAPYFNDANNQTKHLNFFANNFQLLNPIEADGIEGALEFLSAIKGISGTPTANEIIAMKLALTKMGSRINLSVPGSPYPTASDYSNWSNIKISKVGQLFYGARVVTNSGFDNLATLIATVTNPSTNPGRELTNLSQQPYELNFVFEIEAEKIAYAFSF